MESVIISETEFQKARNRIRKNKGKKIIFSGSTDELNRKVLEKEKIDVLLVSLKGRKDYSKQRNSGFNQVMAKIAKKGGVEIGINLEEILETDKKEKPKILARVRQNIEICKKNKLKMKFISKNKQDRYNLKSLGLVLGMPTWMIKEI